MLPARALERQDRYPGLISHQGLRASQVSREAPLEDRLEAALVCVRLADRLLELDRRSAVCELDGRHLVVEERSLDEAPAEVGIAGTRRPGKRAGDGDSRPGQRQADHLPLMGIERISKRRAHGLV